MRDYVRGRELLLVVFVVAVCCCCGLLTSVRVFDGSEAPDWRRGGLVWSCAWYVSSYLVVGERVLGGDQNGACEE